MNKNDIAGYACPICNRANPVSVNYCSQCGYWLLDTVKEPRPLNKKEFRKRTKKPCNPYYRIAFWQGWFALIMLYELAIKSQISFDRTFISYLLGIMIYNFRLGKAQEKAQIETQSKVNETQVR